jgi:hypothetical protein
MPRGKPTRSRGSGADNIPKRIETVTRISGVTDFRRALFALLTTLWRVASIRAGLAITAMERGRLVRLIDYRQEPGSGRIPFQSANLAADRKCYRPGARFCRAIRSRPKPRAHVEPDTPGSWGPRPRVDSLSDPFPPGYDVLLAAKFRGLLV